jgi:hypothetical protein
MQTSFRCSFLRSLRFLCLPLLLHLLVFSACGQQAEIIDSLNPANPSSTESPEVRSTPLGASVWADHWLESKPDHPGEDSVPQGALLRVRPKESLSLSRLKSGSLISGTLLRPLYSQDREVVPVDSQIQLVVEKSEKQRHTHKRAREFAARLWNPLSAEKVAYSIVFRSAGLELSDGRTAAMNVSFGRLLRFVKIQPRPGKDTGVLEPAGKQTNRGEGIQSARSTSRLQRGKQVDTLILRLENSLTLPKSPESEGHPGAEGHTAFSENSAARLSLLSSLSATGNHEGDWFQARLVEPLQLDGRLISEGSLFEGRVTRRTAPRRLRRAGSLFVNFERIITPSGKPIPINSSLISVEADRKARLRLDSEGMLHGRAPGVAAYAVDLGMSYLSGKIVDDLLEEGIKAAVAGITTEKAASIGRYFGLGTGLCLFLMRRGRDVSLEQYSELEVSIKPRLEGLSRDKGE